MIKFVVKLLVLVISRGYMFTVITMVLELYLARYIMFMCGCCNYILIFINFLLSSPHLLVRSLFSLSREAPYRSSQNPADYA